MNWRAFFAEFALDLLLMFLLIVFSSPDSITAAVPSVFKFTASGQQIPLTEVQGIVSAVIGIVLFFLLFSSVAPVILRLLDDAQEELEKLR